jgi:hypothetical protein
MGIAFIGRHRFNIAFTQSLHSFLETLHLEILALQLAFFNNRSRTWFAP